ncbi:MAG: hypothetical protein ABMB14_07880, partial [Myxococcota bacterium]
WVPREGAAGTIAVSGVSFDDVPTGATFTALYAGGQASVAFAGIREIPWGCGPASVALFDATPPPPPGVVWVTADAAGLTAQHVIERREPSSAWRLYRLPNAAEFDLKPGRTVIELVGARPWVHTFPSPGIDLLRMDQPGPHWPELALVGADAVTVVLRNHTDAGFGWELVRIVGKVGTELGRQDASVQRCPSS